MFVPVELVYFHIGNNVIRPQVVKALRSSQGPGLRLFSLMK